MHLSSRNKGLILVVTGALFWGIGGTVAQKLFNQFDLDVSWLVSTRLLIAGVLLLLLQCILNDRSQILSIWTQKWSALYLVIFGIAGMLTVQYTYMASIQQGNAAVATLLQYLAPVMIIVYMVMRKQLRLTMRDVLAVVLALTGCFLLLTNGSLAQFTVPPAAILWGILSGAALAFYTLFPLPLLKTYDSLTVVGWAMVIGGCGLSLIRAPWQMDFSGLSIEAYAYLIFIIVFGTMLAFWFYVKSLQFLSPKETSLLSSLEPLAAVVTTVFWLHTPFGIFQWVGTACIIGLILLMAINKSGSTDK